MARIMKLDVSILTPERSLVWAIIQQAVADCKPLIIRKRAGKEYRKICRRNTLSQRDARDFLMNKKRIGPLLEMLDINYDYWKAHTIKLLKDISYEN